MKFINDVKDIQVNFTSKDLGLPVSVGLKTDFKQISGKLIQVMDN